MVQNLIVPYIGKRKVQELKAGRAIDCPVYDYSNHNRSNEVQHIEPAPVLISHSRRHTADLRYKPQSARDGGKRRIPRGPAIPHQHDTS